jgi:hypothetical protein
MTQIRKRSKSLAARLRDAACGRYVWRVQDKITHAYCIEFTDWEKPEAEAWWEKEVRSHPDYHYNNELARVFILTPAERLMIEAAEILEREER